MARILDDAARSKLLSSLIDQNIGQPATRGLPITDDDVEDEDPPEGRPAAPVDPRGAPAPMPGNEMSRREPMIPVPASLANAGMQALMMQASGNAIGKSMGSDGAMQMAEALVPNDATRRSLDTGEDDSYDGPNAVPSNRLPPTSDPERIEMMRRGRDRGGRSA